MDEEEAHEGNQVCFMLCYNGSKERKKRVIVCRHVVSGEASWAYFSFLLSFSISILLSNDKMKKDNDSHAYKK